LAKSGITHIRIPIGYWVFDVEEKEPFPEPPKNDHSRQRFYLFRVVKWAEDLGLKVLLDLHAAPGSQNGCDHSGRMGAISKKSSAFSSGIQKNIQIQICSSNIPRSARSCNFGLIVTKGLFK
jgi:aryl-phospho-beta-D-glucosidase BglC (GH1 family)